MITDRNFKINERLTISIDLEPIFNKGVWIEDVNNGPYEADLFLTFEEFNEIARIVKEYQY